MTDDEKIAIITKLAKRALQEELEYRMTVEHEDPEDYTLIDAFDDTFDFMERLDDAERSFIDNVRDVAIAIGMYVVVTEKQLANTIVSSGKKYSFKHRGKKYNFHR